MSSGQRYSLKIFYLNAFLQYFANIIGLSAYKKSNLFVSSLYTCT